MPSNEGRACDAVLREIERRLGKTRHDFIFPAEPIFPHDQQVEVIGFVGTQKFAFEHTYIEPFDGFRDLEHQVRPFKADLRSQLEGVLDPSASFDLGIPINELRGRRPRDLTRITKSIAAWIAATAPTLANDPYDRAPLMIRQATTEVPFKVTLRRRDLMAFPPRFEVYSLVPYDTERLRRARLRVAYRHKLSKLLTMKKAHGARTVLTLEESDIAGTNVALVGAAVRRVEKGRLIERPDEVYLLSTAIDSWYLYPIRVGRGWLYDKGESTNRYRELDPAQLRDIISEGRNRRS